MSPGSGMELWLVMIVPAAVSSMHEHVHERASQQEQIGQSAEDVRFVLVPEQKGCDGGQQTEAGGPRQGTTFALLMGCFGLHISSPSMGARRRRRAPVRAVSSRLQRLR
jgi:hypothetical protein